MRFTNTIWPKFIIFGALICSTLVFSTERASAQSAERWETGVSEPLWFPDSVPTREIEEMKRRWDAVRLEQDSLEKSSVAGDYSNGGETHGSLLRWAPTSGYVLLHVDKCAASVMGFSYGSIVLTPTTLELVPEAEISRGQHHGHGAKTGSQKYLFVSWRNVLYLPQVTEIQDFLDSLAGLGKYNGNTLWDLGPGVFAKGGPFTGTADDVPVVPLGYERFVKRPINLTIAGVGRRYVTRMKSEYNEDPQYESRTVVVIDGGRAERVRPGMKFYVLDSTDSEEVIVRSVGPHTSRGEIIRSVEPNPTMHFSRWPDYDNYRPVKSGWKISTSIHKQLDAYRAAEEQATTAP